MTMRRLRATFLLRFVILTACVLLVGTVLTFGTSSGARIAALAIAALLWFVGLELGLLPWWIERVLTRFAGRSDRPVDSIWFVDRDREQTEREQFHDESRDNPTIR